MLLLEMLLLLLLLEIQPYQMLLLAMLPSSWALYAMMIGQTVTEHVLVNITYIHCQNELVIGADIRASQAYF